MKDRARKVMPSGEFRELFMATLEQVRRELEDPNSEASKELDAALFAERKEDAAAAKAAKKPKAKKKPAKKKPAAKARKATRKR